MPSSADWRRRVLGGRNPVCVALDELIWPALGARLGDADRFVLVAPLTVVNGLPEGLGREEVGWLAIAGASGNVGGLLVAYAALRVGKVSIVSPISSAEGAIAAVLAIATGETVGGTVGLMLVVIAVGVVLASIAPGGASGDPLRASLLASAAALCFGASLYATGRVSETLPLVWALIPRACARRGRRHAAPARNAASAHDARHAATRPRVRPLRGRRLRVVRRGSRHGIAVSAVLASQFAALSAIGAYFFFGERLTRVQLAGVAAIVFGVAVLTASQA